MKSRLLLFLTVFPAVLGAQVGYRPEESPFRDINLGPRIGLYGGWYVGADDEAGILPKGGPILGARFDVHLGGPADIALRLSHVSSQRDVIDPTKSAGQRLVERRDISLGILDLGLAFSLTGAKSWHNLMPMLHGSVGLITDFEGRDVGGFAHGTTFTVGYGLGLRYVPPSSRLTFRVDAGSYIYSLEYPTSYYAPSGDGTSVLDQSTQRAQWRNNWTLSAGLAYALFR
jgi:hypothetical protein